MNLLSLLGSPQAAATVNELMQAAYRGQRRAGRTHEEARETAIQHGDWWVREMSSGFVKSVDGEPIRPKQLMVPQGFLSKVRKEEQKERLW